VPLVLVLSVLAADPLALGLSSKRAGAEGYAPKVLAKVRAALTAEGLSVGTADFRTCQGDTACLKREAERLSGVVVVGVDVGRIAKSLALHLEAVSSKVAEPLAVADLSASAAAWQSETADGLQAFAKSLAEKLRQPEPPPPATAQRDVFEEASKAKAAAPEAAPPVPAEQPPPNPALEVHAQPATGSSASAVRWVPAAVGAAVLIGSGVFLGLGLHEKAIVDGSITAEGLSNLPESVYDQHRNTGNTELTAALATLVLGLALAATTGILLATQ
jgi:hypothetical protein